MKTIKSEVTLDGTGSIEQSISDHIESVEGSVPDLERVKLLALLVGMEYGVDLDKTPAGFQFSILSPDEFSDFARAYQDRIRTNPDSGAPNSQASTILEVFREVRAKHNQRAETANSFQVMSESVSKYANKPKNEQTASAKADDNVTWRQAATTASSGSRMNMPQQRQSNGVDTKPELDRPDIKSEIVLEKGGDIKDAIDFHIFSSEGEFPDTKRTHQLAMMVGWEYGIDPENAPADFAFKILSPEEHLDFNKVLSDDARKGVESIHAPEIPIEERFKQVRKTQEQNEFLKDQQDRPDIKSDIYLSEGGDIKEAIESHLIASEGEHPDPKRTHQLAMMVGWEYDIDPDNAPAGSLFKILSPEEHKEFNQALSDDARQEAQLVKTPEDYQAYVNDTLDLPDIPIEERFKEVRAAQEQRMDSKDVSLMGGASSLVSTQDSEAPGKPSASCRYAKNLQEKMKVNPSPGPNIGF